MTVKIIAEKCDKAAGENKKLPYTAYLVEYKLEDKITYDIAIADSTVHLFDYYYDKYKKDFIKFSQAGGLANPKLWNNKQAPVPQPPKKGKK
tara:strand:- start:5955 stop:6230 length:276 start_codon:yes stop_codon:yes gene_type:complete